MGPQKPSEPSLKPRPILLPQKCQFMVKHQCNNENIAYQILKHKVNVRPSTDIILILLRDHPIQIAQKMSCYDRNRHLIVKLNPIPEPAIHRKGISFIHEDNHMHIHNCLDLLALQVNHVESNGYEQSPSYGIEEWGEQIVIFCLS